MKTTYAYDIDKNIQELNIQLNGELIAKNRYAYDESGNRTEKQQLRGTTTYTYDSLNRLTKAQYPDYGEELYYDKTGNRTKRIANGIEEYYNYDERNRLTSHIKQGKETQYTYDNAGNLLDDGERKYEYDGFNRTTRVETRDGQVQINRYDAEGLRHEIEENGKLVQFIYNENKEVIVEKTDENLKRLIRSSDLWASECTHEKTWYHYASDEQGSIVFIADDEEVKNRYEYDAFGNAVICEEKVENRYKYTGQQYDQITQQYYLRARYYNPVIARFTQEDAYRGDGLNLYAYCDNNPVKYYDPSGYVCDEKYNLYRQYREQGMSAQEAQRRASLDMAGGDAAEAARRRDARIANQQARQRANQEANQPKKPTADVPNAQAKIEYDSTYEERVKRTPVNGPRGEWTGDRGESTYKPTNSEVNQILKENNVDGIAYNNAVVDFSPVSRADVKIKDMSNNRNANFAKADENLAKEMGKTKKEIAEWRSKNNLTWHECNDKQTMQLVPSEINSYFGHLGGVGEINAALRK